MKTPFNPSSLLKSVAAIALFLNMFSVSAQDKPNDEFKPSGKVWGYAFGDYFYKIGGAKAYSEKNPGGADSLYITQGDTTLGAARWGNAEFAKVTKDYQAFTFRRIYLGYDYQFTPKISSRLLFEGSDGVTTPGGDRTVFVKALYLEWKDIIPNQTLKLGQISTPSWPTFTETKWAYRSIEKTIPDKNKISRSNDVGIGFSGIIADLSSTPSDTAQKPKSLFNVSYNAMVGNGRGPKPEDNRFKNVYAEVIFKIMNSIYIEGFVEYEPINKGVYIGGPNSGQSYNTDKTIFRGFLGYEHEKFMVGIEYLTQLQKNGKENIAVDSATSAKKDTMDWTQTELSFWIRGTLIKDKLYAFARYDIFNNDADRSRGWEYYNKISDLKRYQETLLIVGFDWRPAKNVQVMPNLWVNSYKDMSSDIVDYTATGANEYKLKTVTRVPDVVARVTLMYKF